MTAVNQQFVDVKIPLTKQRFFAILCGMNNWKYMLANTMAVACIAMAAAVVLLALGNQRIQADLQARQAQAQAQGSALTPQGQQILGSIVQDMAAAASKNGAMKVLLSKYGLNVQNPPVAPIAPIAPIAPVAPVAPEQERQQEEVVVEETP